MATRHGVVGLVESGSWVRGRVETSAPQFRQITLRRALRMRGWPRAPRYEMQRRRAHPGWVDLPHREANCRIASKPLIGRP